MNVKSVLTALTRGIRLDTERCNALLPLLERQQRLLAAADSEGLTQVGEEISVILNQLGTSIQERVRCFADLGLPADPQGMALLLKKLPAPVSAAMRESWDGLELALARCKALNERNGEMLASQRAILSEIMGKPITEYGEPGKGANEYGDK